MTTAPATQQIATRPAPDTSRALAQFGSRDDIYELTARIKAMLPGGDKLTDNQVKALAQGSLAHKLDPFNGEIWMIPGRGLMVGVKGLRRLGRKQVIGNFWTEFFELRDAETRKRLRIPDGSLAFECRLFDSENLNTYVNTCERLLKAGIPWEAVKGMVGDKPYTPGMGVLLAGEQTKMQPVQCAMKRAEAYALKRRFDVPLDIGVDESGTEPETAAWVESGAPADEAPHGDRAAVNAALYDEPPVGPGIPTPPPPDNAALDREIVESEKHK